MSAWAPLMPPGPLPSPRKQLDLTGTLGRGTAPECGDAYVPFPSSTLRLPSVQTRSISPRARGTLRVEAVTALQESLPVCRAPSSRRLQLDFGGTGGDVIAHLDAAHNAAPHTVSASELSAASSLRASPRRPIDVAAAVRAEAAAAYESSLRPAPAAAVAASAARTHKPLLGDGSETPAFFAEAADSPRGERLRMAYANAAAQAALLASPPPTATEASLAAAARRRAGEATHFQFADFAGW